MKQDLIYTHTYKQTLHMTTGLKSHLEILSKDRQTLSDLLYFLNKNYKKSTKKCKCFLL